LLSIVGVKESPQAIIGEKFMPSKIIKVFIIALTGFIIVYYGLFYFNEVNKYQNFYKSGMVRSRITGPDSSLVFTQVDTLDFVSRPFPKVKTILLQINDSTATTARLNKYFTFPHPPGTLTRIAFIENNDTLTTVVRFRPNTRTELVTQFILMFTRFLLSVFYLGVGLWAFFKRPNSGAVQALRFSVSQWDVS